MRPFQCLALSLLMTLAVQARADVAPPAGFEETCTLDKQARPGQECHQCDAFYGNPEHCPRSLLGFGFTQTCRTRGASVWSEIWCRAASTTATPVPAAILEQLSDPDGKPGPTPSAPSESASAAPAPSPSARPPTPAPTSTVTPAPQPPSQQKPHSGCGMAGDGSPEVPLVAAAGILLAVWRRRRGCK
ncbi:MAG TPA: hypothetical protein VHM70_07105 [Polyangiaceae bacterium]|nr:hypothetical protein [Polyangiaceae bacterium]